MEKKYRGKSNLQIVQNYLDGVRPFTQLSMRVLEKDKYHNEGEEWKVNEKCYKKVNGKTVCLTKTQGDMIREMIRQKCKCGQNINWGTKVDQQLFNRTGLCSACLIDYETKLRILGIYDYYEGYKLLSYELGEITDIKSKLEEVIKFFDQDSGDVTMLCNSEGFIERWKHNNPKEILDGAKRDLKLAKKRITFLKKSKEAAKKKYLAGATKFKLEIYA